MRDKHIVIRQGEPASAFGGSPPEFTAGALSIGGNTYCLCAPLCNGTGMFERTGKAFCLTRGNAAVIRVVGQCCKTRGDGNDRDDGQDFNQGKTTDAVGARRPGPQR